MTDDERIEPCGCKWRGIFRVATCQEHDNKTWTMDASFGSLLPTRTCPKGHSTRGKFYWQSSVDDRREVKACPACVVEWLNENFPHAVAEEDAPCSK